MFAVLLILHEAYDPDAPEDAPGWRLMEGEAESDRLTGRDVGGLHELAGKRCGALICRCGIVHDATTDV